MLKTIPRRLNFALPANISHKSLIFLILLGFIIRAIIWAFSIGSNDVDLWIEHATLITDKGLIGAYQTPGLFNHPPLPALYAKWAFAASEFQLQNFAKLIKLPSFLGDILIVYLLAKHYSLRLAAVFSLLPASILVTAFHGNTDSLLAAFLLAAVIYRAKDRYFLSGLFFALSLNVKLIPLVFLFPFFFLCKTQKNFLYFLGGLFLGMSPYYYPLLTVPIEMYRNMLKYNSNQDNWGFQFFFNELMTIFGYDSIIAKLSKVYSSIGRYVILLGNILIALESRFISKNDFVKTMAICSAFFFFITHGFSVQYVVVVLPLFLIHDEDKGNFWGIWSGVFIGSIYYIFMKDWNIFDSHFTSIFPSYTKYIGLIPWLLCAKWIYDYFKTTKRNLKIFLKI